MLNHFSLYISTYTSVRNACDLRAALTPEVEDSVIATRVVINQYVPSLSLSAIFYIWKCVWFSTLRQSMSLKQELGICYRSAVLTSHL